jgi:DNA-binding NarL/FixJ family response regulator
MSGNERLWGGTAMEKHPRLLICDDDPLVHGAIKHSLKGSFETRSAYDSEEALAILRNHPVDLILLDVQMRTPDEGLHAIRRFRDAEPDAAVVMLSGLSDFQTVREAMRLGAADYLPKGRSA